MSILDKVSAVNFAPIDDNNGKFSHYELIVLDSENNVLEVIKCKSYLIAKRITFHLLGYRKIED